MQKLFDNRIAPIDPAASQASPRVQRILANQSSIAADPRLKGLLDTPEVKREIARRDRLAEPGEGFTLSEGQQRFDAQGRRIAGVADKSNLSSLEKNARAAGFIPGTPEFQEFIKNKVNQQRGGRFAKSPSVIVRDEQGNQFQSIPVLDQSTGEMVNKLIPIGGELVSRVGETPLQTQERAIETAGGTVTAKGQATRIQTTINDGINAAEGLGTLNRSLELLQTIKTGGLAGAQLRFEQFFGVQGADEAELGANLLRTVLSQLRPTFGAQFTEREGTKLERIEAGIGKSTEGNIRVLKQLKTIIEREARRGITAAKKSGDDFSAEEIDRLIKFKITAPKEDGISNLSDDDLLKGF